MEYAVRVSRLYHTSPEQKSSECQAPDLRSGEWHRMRLGGECDTGVYTWHADPRVTGVYERVPGSDIWSARIRVERQAGAEELRPRSARWADAIAWVEKARTIKRTGEGVLPKTAKRPVLTTAEVACAGGPKRDHGRKVVR